MDRRWNLLMKNKTRNLKFYLLNKVVLNIAAALET